MKQAAAFFGIVPKKQMDSLSETGTQPIASQSYFHNGKVHVTTLRRGFRWDEFRTQEPAASFRTKVLQLCFSGLGKSVEADEDSNQRNRKAVSRA
jgi:hypothetical protein